MKTDVDEDETMMTFADDDGDVTDDEIDVGFDDDDDDPDADVGADVQTTRAYAAAPHTGYTAADATQTKTSEPFAAAGAQATARL